MKKLLLSLMLLPLLGAFTACDNDSNDLPEVDIEVAISGAVQNPDDNKIYVQQGTPLVIDGITAVSRNGKKTTLGLTTYYLNGVPQFQTVTVPFGAEFSTADLEPGEYAFQIKTSVYQIDKSAAVCLLTYALVVEPADDESTDVPGQSIVKPDEQQLAEQ